MPEKTSKFHGMSTTNTTPVRIQRSLPAAPTVDALMLLVAGARIRIHVQPENRRWWVQSRFTPRRGWWAVLWPWPDGQTYSPWHESGPYKQFPGLTLPVYCATREEAVAWAWVLAEQLGYPENQKRRRFVREDR